MARVAVHVHDLNAIESLLAGLRNMSGFLDPLEFFEPIITGAENLSIFDNIALFDVLDAHCPTLRSACATWPLCVAWLPSPCAACGSVPVVVWQRPLANASHQMVRCAA